MTGVVQGVGFRPFVHNLAVKLGLDGFVGNGRQGVFIEVEGPRESLDLFERTLAADGPPAAIVLSVTSAVLAPRSEPGFLIVASESDGRGRTLVAPDLRTCVDCLEEMLAPQDRRHRYPFINCTNCGPRFTIIESMPYDRPATTMRSFAMCDRCRHEYEDPADRRFHAQPNACPQCGPRIELLSGTGDPVDGDPIETARHLVDAGQVVAVKGLGGFHLACDGRSDTAVSELRRRKGRVDKPFAVMVADVETARTVGRFDDEEIRLLTSRSRPIVLVREAARSGVSPLVAPGIRDLGVLLPYTPLHHLLVQPGEVWVMTSGNRSQEPIVIDNDDALVRLADLADSILMHDRPIVLPVDDSVIRVESGQEMPIRRSRGYAPFPIELPLEVPATLAVGAELKATFCLAEGREAFMSQHIGDLEDLETLAAFSDSVEHLQRLFGIDPAVLVTDLHPRYLSTRWAEEHAGLRPVVKVQHHHAHLASLLAEHGETGRIIGFSFDGTGYGSDGTVWGGEVMVADLASFERAGHLASVDLPGGDATVRRPYRMALAHLRAAGVGWEGGLAPVEACPPAELTVLAQQLERRFNTVPTTSVGRLFDAVASLVGLRHEISYEGQAAIELEAAIDSHAAGEYRFDVGDRLVIEPGPVVAAIVADLRDGASPGVVALRFHRGLAKAMLEVAERLRQSTGIGTVGCSGGVFQNATLTAEMRKRMEHSGFRVLTHRLVPCNDGGLALGQVVVAAARS